MCETLLLPQVQTEALKLNARFFRCRGLLYFVAARLLDSREQIEKAVNNCLLIAPRKLASAGNTKAFKTEGAFRNWLVRILMDEALQILHEEKEVLPVSFHPAMCTLPAEMTFWVY